MRLGDVAIIKNGMTPSKEEQRSTGFPVLKIKDITASGDFVGMYDSFVDPGLALSLTHKYVDVGDSLILNAAHNADYVGSKICQVTEAFAGSLATGEWMIIRSDATRADRTYIYYWLQFCSSIGLLASLVRGIHLYPKDVGGIEMTLPPIAEQRRIAAILRAADDERRRRRYTQALSDGLLGEVFVRMFGDPATNPMGWEIRTLGTFMSFVTSGSRGWAEHYSSSGAQFIRVQNLHDHRLDLEDIAYVMPPQGAEAARTQVHPNDLLLAITGATIGLCAIVPDGIGESYVSQHVAIIRLGAGINPVFASSLISHPRGGQLQISAANYGDTKPGLSLDQIRNLIVICPPLELQRQFAIIAAAHEQTRRQQQESARQSEHLFDTLLHRAFAGEL